MGRYNLSDAPAADRRQDRQLLRTHPTRRPREDIFRPEQNALSPCRQFFCALRRRSGSRRSGGAVLAPAELATVDPHPVQNRPGAWRPRRWLDAPAPLSHPYTSAELTTADVIQSDTFKSAITGEPIPGKILYKDMVDFRPVAQHVIATNKLPPFAGGIDKGIRRRLLVLVFNRVIPEHEMIVGIADLILRDEYDLLLAWAIEGASRSTRNGKFTLPKSSIEALEKWTRDTDPVRAWIEARVRPSTNAKRDAGYTRTVLFQMFETWAVENGHRKDRLPKCPEFIDRVAEDFPAVLHRCEQDRRVRGITVLSEDWADKPQLRDCDKYDDSSINQAFCSLFDRVDQEHREWLVEKGHHSDEE
jgi:hypothetical protein